jgi:hypothetical protein
MSTTFSRGTAGALNSVAQGNLPSGMALQGWLAVQCKRQGPGKFKPLIPEFFPDDVGNVHATAPVKPILHKARELA